MLTAEQVLKVYVETGEIQRETTLSGNYRVGNRAHDRRVRVFKKLEKDLELAKEVIDYDDVVDDLFVMIKSDLIELIRQNANNGDQAIDLIMIAKYFERIGDHATNIAEWIVFSLTGIHKNSKIMI